MKKGVHKNPPANKPINNDQPSTSGNQNPEARAENFEDERLNESLESYAKAYNLSALNVKNIIYVRV